MFRIIIAGSLWQGSREGIRYLAGVQGFTVNWLQARSFHFIARSFHSVSVKLDVKHAFFWLLSLKNKVYTRVMLLFCS